MKTYLVQQRLLNLWRSSFYIQNEAGDNCFEVKSDIHMLFRLTIYDLNGQPLAKIKKRYFRIFPRFDVYSPDGNLLFKVKAKFALFSRKAKIISKHPDYQGLRVKGNILAWEFDIVKGEQTLARISKKLFRLTDTYSVSILDELDSVNYLAIAIIMDCMHHKKRSKFVGMGRL
jgi:uncharacterized protein YxjI